MRLSSLPIPRRGRMAAAVAAADEDRVRAAFERVAPFTVGVEEEYLLVDPDTLEPAPVAHHAVSRAPRGLHLAPEFRASQVEAITAPCATVAELEHELARARSAVAAAVHGRALLIACGANPSSGEPGPITPLPRYRQLAKAHPWAARHTLTCGLHVHVAVSGADRALAVHNALRGYLPELVALAANAPFHEGRDSGLATVRPKLNEAWPRHGVPPAFTSWSDVAALARWADDSGVYPDPSYQWWDLRLHATTGTLEVRAPDVQTRVEDTAAVAALVQSLVYDLACRYDAGETLPSHPHERIGENMWLATRDGLAGSLADSVSGRRMSTRERLLQLAEELLPAAAALGCDRELLGIGRIAVTGGGAAVQRRLLHDTDLAGLVWGLAEETQPGAARGLAPATLDEAV